MSHKDEKRILIVEDEPSLVFTLRDTLESEGYIVEVVTDGNEAIETAISFKPDLILLDLMLPGKSGFDICKELREMGHGFPVIMLTAKDQEVDKVTGLTIGADDYITKPFGVKELLARIHARLRRSVDYDFREGSIHRLLLGPVRIDLDEAQVHRPGQEPLPLTTREVELLRYMIPRANQAISRDELLEQVWRYEHTTNTRTVDVHISKLRAKIELHPDDPRFLVTLHGVGYLLKMS